MNRSGLTDGHPIYRPNMKSPRQLDKQEWQKMNRFEKICWLWKFENQSMRTHALKTIQFEQITADYRYFEEHLIKDLNLNINRQSWERMVRVQINPSKLYRFPSYHKWPEHLKNSFIEICGSEMEKLGYNP
jgi:hypothetical protein